LVQSLFASSDYDVTAPTVAPGRLRDIEGFLRRLASGSPNAFLVITVSEPDAFLQLSVSPDGFELDQPLATDGQQERESRFREFCEMAKLELRVMRGSDGTRFLDCDLPRDPVAASAATAAALKWVYNVTPEDELRFSGHGIAKVAA
jgi:hypothetical protein